MHYLLISLVSMSIRYLKETHRADPVRQSPPSVSAFPLASRSHLLSPVTVERTVQINDRASLPESP